MFKIFPLLKRTIASGAASTVSFDDPFEVFDVDSSRAGSKQHRELVKTSGDVQLCLNYVPETVPNETGSASGGNSSSSGGLKQQMVLFYEILYTRKKIDGGGGGGGVSGAVTGSQPYSFSLYRTKTVKHALERFEMWSPTLNNLDAAIPAAKPAALETLKAVMSSLKINPHWSSTHLAARLGFDVHFETPHDTVAQREINLQVDPDRYTPLHLAISQRMTSTVKAIIRLNPNLDLVDSQCYSVLHRAACSTYDIFYMILPLPGMFDRILWKNLQGCTALHLACFAQNYSIVLEFLRFGCTVRMLSLVPPKPLRTLSARLRQSERSRTRMTRRTKYDQVVNFYDQDLADLDDQDIGLAGGPLHWAKHRRLTEKLIEHRFKLNLPNVNGDTALHVMIKRSRSRCVLALLCADAKVNLPNLFGNTPLHSAIKMDEIHLIQTLLVFDADLNAVNRKNESPRHLAARDSTIAQQCILYLLSSLGARRCPAEAAERLHCTAGCSATGDYEGRWNWAPSVEFAQMVNSFESFFHNIKNSAILEQEMKRDPADIPEVDRKRQANMLTLDGGGIKGLVIIQVLMEFQRHLDRPIIDYFNWVAGTSTGSFIAVYLAIGKSLQEIRSIYFRFKDKVLVGERPYDAEPLETLVKDTYGPDLRMEDLKTQYNKYIIIPAVLYDRVPTKLHLFRSYESPHELMNIPDADPGFTRQPSKEQLVWKACRASGAAPTYFRAFGPFVDGGIIANNPTLDALTEFTHRNHALCSLGRFDECQTLKFVLSLGTGQQQVEETKANDISVLFSLMELNSQIRYYLQLANMLLEEVTNTDNHIVNRAEAFCSTGNILYFRVNPVFNKLIDLDESMDFKIINILWETKRFMYLKQAEVDRVVKYLKKFTFFEDNKQQQQQQPPSSSPPPASETTTTKRPMSETQKPATTATSGSAWSTTTATTPPPSVTGEHHLVTVAMPPKTPILFPMVAKMPITSSGKIPTKTKMATTTTTPVKSISPVGKLPSLKSLSFSDSGSTVSFKSKRTTSSPN